MAAKTDMNKDIDHVLLSREQIAARVAELGARLSEDYEGKDVILVCILKGAVHFFSDLSRSMTCHLEMDFMSISSYGNNARKTSGIVRIAKDLDTSITGRHVLIVEDIMDSGLTHGRIVQQKALREQTMRNVEKKEESIRSEVSSVYLDLKTAPQVLEEAKLNLKLAEEGDDYSLLEDYERQLAEAE